jgi:hypothetical protein
MAAAPSQGPRRVAVAALGASLLGLYLFTSFGLSGSADITGLNSSIFDLDVGRIVADWTSNAGGHRTHVHPLSVFAAVTRGAANLQAAVYPGTGTFTQRKPPTKEFRSFNRLESVERAPLWHTARLAGHFVGVNFVAPFPGYSDFVIERWRQPYWSLSLEESRLEGWHPAQVALFGIWLFALLPAPPARPQRRPLPRS